MKRKSSCPRPTFVFSPSMGPSDLNMSHKVMYLGHVTKSAIHRTCYPCSPRLTISKVHSTKVILGMGFADGHDVEIDQLSLR